MEDHPLAEPGLAVFEITNRELPVYFWFAVAWSEYVCPSLDEIDGFRQPSSHHLLAALDRWILVFTVPVQDKSVEGLNRLAFLLGLRGFGKHANCLISTHCDFDILWGVQLQRSFKITRE